MVKLRIASVNVRGLGEQHKRRDVLRYLKKMNFDIIFLQDTHLTAKKVPFFNALWKGKAYHSCYSHNSRGTSILIDHTLQHDVLFDFICEEGNYVIIGCKIGSDTYIFGSIYGPNKDEPNFYKGIDELLSSVDVEHIIIGGDLNFVMNPQKDCFGYTREHNVNARNAFASICDKYNLLDIWRMRNVEKEQYTWMRNTPRQGARLDMFFISEHLSSLCFDTKIYPGYRTDHSIISISMCVGESERGPGLWKFNESLLSDEHYIATIDRCIERTIEQYALPIYSPSFLFDPCNYKDINFQIKDDLFYETLLMMIRGETIKFSKQKAKRTKTKERELVTQIENAHAQYCETKSEECAVRLRSFKDELESMRKSQIDGVIVRSRTTWHEEGERSSKFFLGLEKRNALRKSATLIKVGDQIVTRTNSILFFRRTCQKIQQTAYPPELSRGIYQKECFHNS